MDNKKYICECILKDIIIFYSFMKEHGTFNAWKQNILKELNKKIKEETIISFMCQKHDIMNKIIMYSFLWETTPQGFQY